MFSVGKHFGHFGKSVRFSWSDIVEKLWPVYFFRENRHPSTCKTSKKLKNFPEKPICFLTENKSHLSENIPKKYGAVAQLTE